MDATFHKVDLETWERREEYEYFSRGGCGFTMTAELDITHLRRYAKEHGAKLYPMLVAVAQPTLPSNRRSEQKRFPERIQRPFPNRH